MLVFITKDAHNLQALLEQHDTQGPCEYDPGSQGISIGFFQVKELVSKLRMKVPRMLHVFGLPQRLLQPGPCQASTCLPMHRMQ